MVVTRAMADNNQNNTPRAMADNSQSNTSRADADLMQAVEAVKQAYRNYVTSFPNAHEARSSGIALLATALRDSGLPGAAEESANLVSGSTNSDASLDHEQVEFESQCYTLIIQPLRVAFPNLVELFEDDSGQLMSLIQSTITNYIEAPDKDDNEEAGRSGHAEVDNNGTEDADRTGTAEMNSDGADHSPAEEDEDPGVTDDSVISPGTRESRKRLSDAMGRELQARGKEDKVTYRKTKFKESPEHKRIADFLKKNKDKK